VPAPLADLRSGVATATLPKIATRFARRYGILATTRMRQIAARRIALYITIIEKEVNLETIRRMAESR
jgi:hypothetical protein